MPSAPYDTVLDCMNLASVRLNDAMKQPQGAVSGQIGGEITGAQQIFSQTVVNGAWQKFQEYLVSKKYPKLVNTTLISSIPVAGTPDPGVFCYLSWAGYFNGVTLLSSPVLPQDLATPLRCKERVHGSSGVSAELTPMEYVVNGLTGGQKQVQNLNWTWDNDRLMFPGSTSIMDFEVRYASYLADFVDGGSPSVSWYQQLVPILRARDAFAWYMVFEYSLSRGDMDSAQILPLAEGAADRLIAREQQNEQLRTEWVIPSIPAATGATPYDAMQSVLNGVKTRLNSLAGASADILITNQPFMQEVSNLGWRKTQVFLANLGYIKFTSEVDLTGLLPKVSQDPSVQCWLDWTGYFNGTTLDTAIQLPQDLILPMRLWERVTGQEAIFCPMTQWLDGLPTVPQTAYNRIWEWRGNRVYFVGANSELDIRVRYAMYEGDFITDDDGPWYQKQVPVVRAKDSLSLFICYEIARSRPDLELDAAAFKAEAEAEARLIFNRDMRQKQRTNIRRMSRSGRLEARNTYGWGAGWNS